MSVRPIRDVSNPLTILELVSLVVSYVDSPRDLVYCACVNSTWNTPALQKLYRGSMNDMRFRTPDIGWLNSLFVASPERFTRNAGFTKHLTIASEINTRGNSGTLCVERCRLLLHHKRAQLLLRPRGKGPTSLAIPFPLVKHNLFPMSDLILHSGLRFLTIDNDLCEGLVSDYSRRGDHSVLSNLSNLVGLSIYRSRAEYGVARLCDWLSHCDLKIFQVEQCEQPSRHWRHKMEKLLQSLWRQQGLRALALRINCNQIDMDDVHKNLEEQMGTVCWPRLQALYLQNVKRYWPQKLSSFKELQILELSNLKGEFDQITDLAACISRCRRLNVIHLCFEELYNPDIFLTIARGCPLLRRFCVSTGTTSTKLSYPDFSLLVQALPNVELLGLCVICNITASTLQDLATCCPRLEVLEMGFSRMHLSQASLAKVPPLSKLRVLRLFTLWFKNPYHYDQWRCLKSLATEWSRVFPQLRRPTCDIDLYEPSILERVVTPEPDAKDEDWTTNNDGETTSHEDGDMNWIGSDLNGIGDGDDMITTYSDSDLEHMGWDVNNLGDDQSSYWRTLRISLWKLLRYNMDDELGSILLPEYHMWQTNFEIDILGWPVIPSEVYLKPENYYLDDET